MVFNFDVRVIWPAFHVPRDIKLVIMEMLFPDSIWASTENLEQQNQTIQQQKAISKPKHIHVKC